MSEPNAQEKTLRAIVDALDNRSRGHALVGGLAISVRAEVRFTRDVDLAVSVRDDADAESLVRDLSSVGYRAIASVEHEVVERLSTVRLMSQAGVVVDLLFASSGIEDEIAQRSTFVEVPSVGVLRVARAEELLAMKVLSMRDARLQDRIDAQRLIEFVPGLDLEAVRANLRLVSARGYDRGQDLLAKLDAVIADVDKQSS